MNNTDHNTQLLDRGQVARRWSCSRETVKRRERAGILRALKLSSRATRYRLEEVIRVEKLAEGGAS